MGISCSYRLKSGNVIWAFTCDQKSFFQSKGNSYISTSICFDESLHIIKSIRNRKNSIRELSLMVSDNFLPPSDFYFLTSDFLGSFQTPHPPLKSTIINGCSLSKNMVKYIIIWYIQFEQILCSTYYLWILLSFLPAWTEIELKNLEKILWKIFGRLSFFGEASGCWKPGG